MNINILINQIDEHNEGSILLCQKIKPQEVYYIANKGDEDKVKSIKEYYSKSFKNIILNILNIEEGDLGKLYDFIEGFNNKNILVNITGGKRINSLILLKICIEKKIKAVYLDIKNRNIYQFMDTIKIINEEFDDLEIKDIVKAAGGEVLEDSLNLCYKEDLIYFSQKIYENLAIWHKYKQKLYDNEIFNHDINDSNRVYINNSLLNEEEHKLIDIILNKLKEMNELDYLLKDSKITVTFNNEYIKAFIFKSGTWLEIATNNLIRRIKEIDESKNGVVFLWNDENKSVRNEVDVVAVKDSIPICISCKDSDKYNEIALNELNVYGEKIGGKNTIKILVATKEPIKQTVRVRAKEMGIHLVIFDGDENKFINTIKSIIKAK